MNALEVRCPSCGAPPRSRCLGEPAPPYSLIRPLLNVEHAARQRLRQRIGAGPIPEDTCLECGSKKGTNTACEGCMIHARWLNKKKRGGP